MEESQIDWTDGTCSVTEHFTVNDCLMLHQWSRLATLEDGYVAEQLEALCATLEQVRELLGCAMNVHCIFRSSAYNKLIGAPEDDVHSKSLACDFDVNEAMTIEAAKEILLPKLEELGIRMEQGTATWIHVDIAPVGVARYFLP